MPRDVGPPVRHELDADGPPHGTANYSQLESAGTFLDGCVCVVRPDIIFQEIFENLSEVRVFN